ncbi:hypothetical protein M1555_03200 [Patescibacteria group bacterium]|nr:hypothetical protein [Patescibacteria group bacterium]
MATSLETYYNDKGAYPAGDANGGILGCTPDDVTLCPWGGEFVDKNGTIYMVKLPSDPAAGDHYYYRKSGSGYQLYAALENTNDADYHAGGYAGTNCAGSGTLLCTYGIASTNLTP